MNTLPESIVIDVLTLLIQDHRLMPNVRTLGKLRLIDRRWSLITKQPIVYRWLTLHHFDNVHLIGDGWRETFTYYYSGRFYYFMSYRCYPLSNRTHKRYFRSLGAAKRHLISLLTATPVQLLMSEKISQTFLQIAPCYSAEDFISYRSQIGTETPWLESGLENKLKVHPLCRQVVNLLPQIIDRLEVMTRSGNLVGYNYVLEFWSFTITRNEFD